MAESSIVIVVNPERREALDELVAELDGETVHVIEPDGLDEFEQALIAAADSADIVAAIGGDGTHRTAAERLKGSDAALAPVPGGTVNLLARVLGISSIADAATAIRSGHRRTLDTGVADGETFVLQSSTGYDAAVMQGVDDSAKRWGRLGYFFTGLRTLWSYRPHRVTVTVDGTDFYAGGAMTVMVTNVAERGSVHFSVAPDSAPDDGRLDVVVQRCDSATTMGRTIWALWRGRDPRPDDLVVAHGRHIEVRWDVPTLAQRDGDAIGRVVGVQYRVDPGSLTVCVP
jgi:diacylglycerol kinase family enzyme